MGFLSSAMHFSFVKVPERLWNVHEVGETCAKPTENVPTSEKFVKSSGNVKPSKF